MPRARDLGPDRIEDAPALHAALLEVSRELELLSSRVAALSAAATELASGGEDGRAGAPGPARSKSQRASRDLIETVTVSVRPLPEIAMAAMAETSLRDLPCVSEVVAVERFDDWARFTLEVVKGCDLVSEVRDTLPVAFRSTVSESGEISLDLKWAWGAGR